MVCEAAGVEKWLVSLREELISKTYRPAPVRRVMLPKPGAENARVDAGASPLEPGEHGPLNHFGINASRPLSEWRKKGWIHPDDPRGWFQWVVG